METTEKKVYAGKPGNAENGSKTAGGTMSLHHALKQRPSTWHVCCRRAALFNYMNAASAIHTHISRKGEAGCALSALGGEHGLNSCAHAGKQLDNLRFPLVMICIETNKW